jgi:hypothetical protein
MPKCTALDAVEVSQTVAHTRWQPDLQFPEIDVGAHVSR